jgi:hypothetical protein
MLKRYNLIVIQCGDATRPDRAEMEESPTGQYVAYGDVEKLLNELLNKLYDVLHGIAVELI